MGYLEERYGGGKTKVYYSKDPDCFFAYTFGTLGEKELPDKCVVDLNDIEKTHALIGSVPYTDLDEIFYKMQGESWSPMGQARNLIERVGASHTSMSVGDIIEDDDGEFWMVDVVGFKRLGRGD